MTARIRRPKGATEALVLQFIATAEKEGREWSYGSIAAELKTHPSNVGICVLRLRAKGKLVEGAQKIVRVGLVIADPSPAQGV